MSGRVETWAARWYEPVLGRLLAPLRGHVAQWCEGRVLDVCCGPGGLARLLCQRGHAVTGLDNDAAMLAEARKFAPAMSWLYADAAHMPLPDASFDTAVVTLALHAMPLAVAEGTLGEMRRVARRVIVADYCLVERNMAYAGCALAHAVEWLVGGEHYGCYRAFMAAGGMEGLLYRQNMQVVERQGALAGAVTLALCEQ